MTLMFIIRENLSENIFCNSFWYFLEYHLGFLLQLSGTSEWGFKKRWIHGLAGWRS